MKPHASASSAALRALPVALLLALGAAGGAHAQALSINVVNPLEGGNVVLEPIGPAQVGGAKQGRISLLMSLRNNDTVALKVVKVEIQDQIASNYLTPAEIAPGTEIDFWNCRCDWPNADENAPKVPYSFPVVIDAPYPATVKIAVYLQGYRNPVIKTLPLATTTNQGGPLRYAGHASDLRPNETWQTSSNHLGGSQAFALDTSVAGWNGSAWDARRPGTDATKAEGQRAYGLPVYAMADGIVCSALNDLPEWKNYPRVSAELEPAPVSPSTGQYSSGGNFLNLKNGNEITLYAHLQPGSIPAELLAPGATVKRGQYLGKVGYTGASSGPHLHVHVSKESGTPCVGTDRRPRPMTFAEIQSLTRAEANAMAGANNMDASDWTALSNHSAPQPYSLIYPSSEAFAFDAAEKDEKTYLGVWRAGNEIEIRINKPNWSGFVAKRNELVADGFRLENIDTFVENGDRHFVGVFKRGSGAGALYNGASWEQFTAVWKQLSDDGQRLVDLTTYLSGSERHYVGVFRPGTDHAGLWSHTGYSAFANQREIAEGLGLRLIDMESFDIGNGQRQYVGVYRAGTDATELARSASWSAFTAKWDQLSDAGYRLIDVDTFVEAGVRNYVGVYRAGSGGYALEAVKSWQGLFQSSEKYATKNLRLVDVQAIE
ncbi:peptidoglycan DD-metalloendopeptidase family protein [Lysobacter sp. K5869]|uniref:peptidoglycan DD-metalloendopeptidase family protein n=1 Tax=Lysobacter sp. K5869 TaxID=2820808 RepID=UPI001C0638BE|nr:peptidoglycan DD-metalloendopeptidase family protein [Lysobacter sp. K5869]QWP78528.1 peptidoglycan DD-metalloendopeptidase family protein [Lysobacter sp. K5869]